MTREQKRKISTVIRYTLLIAVGFIMVYPLIWMVGATFKTNSEIFTSAWFWPKNPVFDGYENAFKNYGGKINLILSMLNTYKIVIPKVVFTIVSATITAYGFARFNFKGKGFMFSMMMATLFLPQVVLNAPQYIMFNKWGWTNSYLPLVIPSLFAADTYFVFMLIQFLRGVPKELEEAAIVDGANLLQQIWYVELPAIKDIIVIQFILQAGNIMSIGFEKAYALQTDMNLPASEILSTYVYRIGLLNGDYGYSTAVGLFNSVINVILLIFVNWVVKKLNDGEGL